MARKRNYLNNKDMMEQLRLSKQQGSMTNEFANMMVMLAAKFAKSPQYHNYTFIDDMQQYALLQVCRAWDKFDEAKYDNCFAFYTQMIKNCFFQYLNKEKKQRVIRDELLIDQGMNPSNTYMTEYEEAQKEYHRE